MSTQKSVAFRILRALIYITGVILVVHLLLQFLNLEVFYQQSGQIYELSNRFDLDDESSVPTWFAQFLFLAVAASAFLAAYLSSKPAVRRVWVGIGSLALIFSIDEVSTLHEHILQSLHVLMYQDAASTTFKNAWWLVGPVVTLLAGYTLWLISKLLPSRTVKLFFISVFIFLTGAIVIDALTSVVPRDTFMNQGILVGVEETMELLGASLALYAIVDYIERAHRGKILRAIEQLKIEKS